MGKFAWVTLATNDSYSLGALVVASSLKRVNTAHELVVLVTPGVSETMKSKLRTVFDLIEVNVLDSQDAAHLALLKRPELGITFTKLHCWRLTQYEKCVFLDADTLILQNCDELFEREELSAAPDVGWPDCFNSGVFVYRPSLDTFGKLVDFATTKGSFDGGDQGLLNQYFSNWATNKNECRLPFIYNTTTTAVYSYIPAFKQYGENVKILHFIGNVKPWLLNFDPQSKTVQAPSGYQHITTFLQLWWTIFCDDVHPNLSPEMNKIKSSYGSTETSQPYKSNEFLYVPPTFKLLSCPEPNNCNKQKQLNYYDPWENCDSNTTDDIPYNIENKPYIMENENNESINYRVNEIHNNVEVAFNYLSELPIHVDYSEIIMKNLIDSNSEIEILSIPNASLIHPSSTQIVPNTILFEEDNTSTTNNEINLLAHINEMIINNATELSHLLPVNHDDNNSSGNESGIAGALAKLTLGVDRSPEQAEFENHMRRQCWESGNIDYLGKDSFDNIWRRITQTIESGIKQDLPSTESEPVKQPESVSVSDEKLKLDIKKQVVRSTLNDNNEPLNPNEHNMIAVCSPHELMRTLSSPGLGEKQVIKKVLPNGVTVLQTILTYPEREIVIEDYERIEIYGPITKKITTETTRIIPGKEEQKDITVTTEVSPSETETKKNIEQHQTTSVNTINTLSTQSQSLETNQNQTFTNKPKNTLNISITDILKPLPGDKVDIGSDNTTTITRKTDTGYEMIIATITPDGRTRVQTKTFFDPVEISSSEEIEEEYTEETTTTTSNVSILNQLNQKAITDNNTKPTENPNTIVVETKESPVNVITGVEKNITETTKEFIEIKTDEKEEEIESRLKNDDTIRSERDALDQTTKTSTDLTTNVEKTKETALMSNEVTSKTDTVDSLNLSQNRSTTVTSEETTVISTEVSSINTEIKPNTTNVSQVEIVEETIVTKNMPSNDHIPNVTSSTISTDVVQETLDTSSINVATNTQIIKENIVTSANTSEESALTTTTTNKQNIVEIPNKIEGETTVVHIEKTPTGHKEITTITSVTGETRIQTKTFYDPTEHEEEEIEEIEEYEETHTSKPTITTVKVPTTGDKSTNKTLLDNTISDTTKSVSDTVDSFNLSENRSSKTTTVTSEETTVTSTEVSSTNKEIKPDPTKIAQVEIVEETIVTRNENMPNSKNSQKNNVTSSTISTDVIQETSDSSSINVATNTQIIKEKKVTSANTSEESALTTTTTNKQKVVDIPNKIEGEKTVVHIEKTPTGHKEITTITSVTGETRIKTKTFYDPVEQEEEEIEEYEETHTSKPTITTVKVPTTVDKSTNKKLLDNTISEKTKSVSEIETTTETINTKTPHNLNTKKIVEKAGKAQTTSVVDQETTISKKHTTTTDTSQTIKQKSNEATTTTQKTKTLKDASKATKIENNVTTDKTKSTIKQQSKQTLQGEPQKTVTTRRIENGTEHTITTVFPDGTKKIETKTFFDEVEVSGDEEEEEYEEYEEEETTDIPTTVKPHVPTLPPVETARKRIVPPVVEPKPVKEDSQFQPSKLKIPAAFASANMQPTGSVRPTPRKIGAKTPNLPTSTTAEKSTSNTKDMPVPPPRKKEVGKLLKTSMLLLLLISIALIYNHCIKRKN